MTTNPYSAPSATLLDAAPKPSRHVVFSIRCGIVVCVLLCAMCWFMAALGLLESVKRGKLLFGAQDQFSLGAGVLACVLTALVFGMSRRNLLSAILFFAICLGLMGQAYRVGSFDVNLGSGLLVGTSVCAALSIYGIARHQRLMRAWRNTTGP